MLKSLRFINYKCFDKQTIEFRSSTIVLGRNNAGKSTIVEALRLVSLVANRVEHLRFSPPPQWAEIYKTERGVSPSLDDLDINFEGVFHRYNDPPAVISAMFENGSAVDLHVGREKGQGRVHGIIRNAKGKAAQNAGEARLARIPRIAILPQVAPVGASEIILNADHVRRNLSTTLSPKHFRNQINLFYSFYGDFRAIAEETWPGLRIDSFIGHGGNSGDELRLIVQNDDFAAEISWMGHGLQMWLQTIWFLARSRTAQVVMLDEPDVYMHPDLQRRLIRFLKERFPQVILTTHSVEMLAEVEPREMLIIDRRQKFSAFADTMPAMQRAISALGATHNIQLSRLWGTKKLLLVEGDDMQILRRFYDLVFPESLDSLATIPSFSIGGWGGWNFAVGSSMLLQNAGGEDISTYCVLDSDYHTPKEIDIRYEDAKKKEVRLHIWERKEIENYLVVPAAIRRIIARHYDKPPSEDEITVMALQIAQSNKHEVYDTFAESFLLEEKKIGTKAANRRSREYLDSTWITERGPLERASGKLLLSGLSEWSKTKFGVSFGVPTILGKLKREDLPAEVIAVISSIAENENFPTRN